MRTFRFLIGGWVLGGALVVLFGIVGSPGGVGGSPAIPPASGRQVERSTVVGLTAAEPSMDGVLIPVQGVVASALHDDFSQPRSDGRTHEALDILAPYGTPVVAAVDGTIRKLFHSGAGGTTIYQFDRAEERVYYYAHLDRYANGLAEGLFVPRGTVIGYVGTSGNANGTPHLHFAIEVLPPTKEWWKGVAIDPYPILTR